MEIQKTQCNRHYLNNKLWLYIRKGKKSKSVFKKKKDKKPMKIF